MRDEELRELLAGPFKILEGEDIFIVFSLEDDRHYMGVIASSGYPMKILQLHSKDNDRALATVFSYTVGKRFMISFAFDNVRPV